MPAEKAATPIAMSNPASQKALAGSTPVATSPSGELGAMVTPISMDPSSAAHTGCGAMTSASTSAHTPVAP